VPPGLSLGYFDLQTIQDQPQLKTRELAHGSAVVTQISLGFKQLARPLPIAISAAAFSVSVNGFQQLCLPSPPSSE
jgi:hypothetical protein